MLKVEYGSHIIKGQFLSKSDVYNTPTITLHSLDDKNKMYTLLMIDPDAPNPEYLHWLIVNISKDKNNILIPYAPPTPPSGIHRYVFYLYEQEHEFVNCPLQTCSHETRAGFNTNTFTKNNKLKFISSVYFKVKKSYLYR